MKLNIRGPLENIYADPQNIIEVEPYDEFTVRFINKTLRNYPVTWGHKAYGGPTDEQDFFGRIFFWDGWQEEFNTRNIPQGLAYLVDWAMNCGPKHIHSKAKFYDMHRIIINGQTPDQAPTAHYDDVNDPTMWTFIYYVTAGDESNGGTMIYNNATEEQPLHTCTYKQGKWIIFPSSYPHQALPCKEQWRMSVGLVLKIHAPQNNTLLVPRKPTAEEERVANANLTMDADVLQKCQDMINQDIGLTSSTSMSSETPTQEDMMNMLYDLGITEEDRQELDSVPQEENPDNN